MKTLSKYLLFILLALASTGNTFAQKLNKNLRKYTQEVVKELDQVSGERKKTLSEIADFIIQELKEDSKADLVIICTQNSRRSHIAQLWLQTATEYYGVKNIYTFSGGLESSAFHPNAIAALERAGFNIPKVQSGDNPRYTAYDGVTSYIMYSKRYTDSQNPQSDFGALMVCSEADKSCPVVEGADKRFSLSYDDPRYYDDTPSQNLKYDETVKEIAREMFYLADKIKSEMILLSETKK